MKKLSARQKKIIMWVSLFIIAVPMPLIIYFGLKFQDKKPAPVKPVTTSPSP